MTAHASVEEYLAACDDIGRARLLAIRTVVLDEVPDATQKISYAIPTFTVGGKVLVHMAAWKAHVSMYPVPEGDEALQSALAPYAVSKGTVTFRHRDPLPLDVVRLVVRASLAQRTR